MHLNLDALIEEAIETAAAIEHDRWSRWYKYQLKNQSPENLVRWDRQSNTDYSELSEREKESDRKEAREYIPIFRLIAEKVAEAAVPEKSPHYSPNQYFTGFNDCRSEVIARLNRFMGKEA